MKLLATVMRKTFYFDLQIPLVEKGMLLNDKFELYLVKLQPKLDILSSTLPDVIISCKDPPFSLLSVLVVDAFEKIKARTCGQAL